MAEADAETTTVENEIVPYHIHVSSKYLDLTVRKLELTRLPHEGVNPRSRDWWEPKDQVEPLIDYWMDPYSWRDQEEEWNRSLPQFRTTFTTFQPPSLFTHTRLHFIHVLSPHGNAVPLLLIPPFPLTNLSLSDFIAPLTDPEDAGAQQPFHLVIPTLPGLGFSDALTNNTPPIDATAGMLDELMRRLDYSHYIVTSATNLSVSPAGIDWKLIRHLVHTYPSSCLGAHLIAPPLAPPSFQKSLVDWTKWTVASSLRAGIVGYSKDDFAELKRLGKSHEGLRGGFSHAELVGDGANLEPNTMAYALCDSPTGLLLYVLKSLRVLGTRTELSPAEIITLAALLWLPGPEGALRFWARCASDTEDEPKKLATKPKIGLTVFLDEGPYLTQGQTRQSRGLPRPVKAKYACPAWAHSRYQVLSVSRVRGKPGFLAFDMPQVIIDGAREFAKALLATDKRMQKSEQPGVALLEQVIVNGGRTAPADLSDTTAQDKASPGLSPKVQGKQAESPVQKGALLVPPPLGQKRGSSTSGEGSRQGQ